MCGICGIWHRGGRAETPSLRAMMDSLIHRGPDDGAGFLFETGGELVCEVGAEIPPGHSPDLALGHRRYTILDLSERGRQPMATPDGRLWVVYNGEIYNFLELRAELESLGRSFQTDTDTEVLLQAYAQWGTGCLSRLNGMFSFALWDSAQEQLFCAVDRFGIKPFYYAMDGDRLVFGSEPKALLASGHVSAAANPRMVFDYLSLRLVDHCEETFFTAIKRLRPGQHMLVRKSGPPVIRTWWTPAVCPDVAWSESEESRHTEELGQLLLDSVRLRLRSDVSIGTCLSGGLDSSLITVLINQLIADPRGLERSTIGENQRTFSACFDDRRFDEREFVDTVMAGTSARNDRTFPQGEGLWEDLDRLLWHMDEPFSSSSQYSQYCVMRLVGQHGVKVTLDGQGADELLAGYPGHYGPYLRTLLGRGELGRFAREFGAAVRMGGRGRGARTLAMKLAYGFVPDAAVRQVRSAGSALFPGLSPEGHLAAVIQSDFARSHADRYQARLAFQSQAFRDFPRRLFDDTFINSLPALLRYEDRNAMAFSIESRTPFLDYRLVEHIFAAPMSLKIRDGWTKRALRDSGRQLPDSIRWRKDKKGFVTPEAIWLKQGKARVREIFDQPLESAAYLDADVVRRRVADWIDGAADTSYYTDVFRWLVLELWLRQRKA